MSALAEQHARWTDVRERLGVVTLHAPVKTVAVKVAQDNDDEPSDFDIPEVNRIRWKRIIREIAKQHDMTVPELLSHRRRRSIVEARQILFFRLYRETSLSLTEIGRRCGGFDHTTVLHGIRMHEKRMGAALEQSLP